MLAEIRMPTLGAYTKQLRDRHNWTQPQLADKAQIGLSTLRKLEQDVQVDFRGHTLDNLANTLCVSDDEREHWWALTGRKMRTFGAPTIAEDVNLLVTQLDPTPAAWIANWRVDLANDAYTRLLPGLVGAESLPQWMFTSPKAKLVLPDWWAEARTLVGLMRHIAVVDGGHGRTMEVIDAVSTVPDFRRLWDSGVVAVAGRPAGLRRIWSPATESTVTVREAIYPTGETGVLVIGFPAGDKKVRQTGRRARSAGSDR